MIICVTRTKTLCLQNVKNSLRLAFGIFLLKLGIFQFKQWQWKLIYHLNLFNCFKHKNRFIAENIKIIYIKRHHRFYSVSHLPKMRRKSVTIDEHIKCIPLLAQPILMAHTKQPKKRILLPLLLFWFSRCHHRRHHHYWFIVIESFPISFRNLVQKISFNISALCLWKALGCLLRS